MATVNFINRPKSQSRAGMSAVMNYTAQDKKTVHDGVKLVSGLNCSPQSAWQEFMTTKLQYGKTDGRMYYHFVQSFPPDEKITPQTAHEIAMKLAVFYKDYEVLVATHSDRAHIHSHFIVNSVSFETGKKLHQKSNVIDEIRKYSDQLCREYGLSICQTKEKDRRVKPLNAAEYHTADKGNSWKLILAVTVDECMKAARSKRHFIELMENEGYKVRWTDERKNITFTTPEGFKCRDNKLHEEKYLKGNMQNEFRIRAQIYRGIKGFGAEEFGDVGTSAEDRDLDRTELGSVDSLPERSVGRDGLAVGAAGQPADSGRYGQENSNAERRIRRSIYEIAGDFGTNESSDREPYTTGWEPERAEFVQSLSAAENDERLSLENILDQSDPGGFDYSLGADAAYLVGDLSRIIDNSGDDIEDSTTIHYRPERKKKDQERGGMRMG